MSNAHFNGGATECRFFFWLDTQRREREACRVIRYNKLFEDFVSKCYSVHIVWPRQDDDSVNELFLWQTIDCLHCVRRTTRLSIFRTARTKCFDSSRKKKRVSRRYMTVVSLSDCCCKYPKKLRPALKLLLPLQHLPLSTRES